MCTQHEKWVNFEIIVGIPLFDKGYNIRYTEYTRSSPRGSRNPQNEINISIY